MRLTVPGYNSCLGSRRPVQAKLEVTFDMIRQKLRVVALLTVFPLASTGLVRAQDAAGQAPEKAGHATRAGAVRYRCRGARSQEQQHADVEKYSPLGSAEDVRSAEGVYDPFLQGQISKNSTDTPAQNAFSGGSTVNNGTWNYNAGLSGLLKTGANWSAIFDNTKQTTDSVFTTYNPSFASSLNLRLSQPLLKNLRTDASRTQIRVAKNNRRSPTSSSARPWSTRWRT